MHNKSRCISHQVFASIASSIRKNGLEYTLEKIYKVTKNTETYSSKDFDNFITYSLAFDLTREIMVPKKSTDDLQIIDLDTIEPE